MAGEKTFEMPIREEKEKEEDGFSKKISSVVRLPEMVPIENNKREVAPASTEFTTKA